MIKLKKDFDLKIKKRIEDGITKIEETIVNDENRNSVESIIESYSKINRTALMGKQSYLIESLSNLCGLVGTELILNLLSRGSNKGSFDVIDRIENPEVRAFLKRILIKYGAQYQWFLEPFQKDWQRYDFSTRYVGVPHLPIVECKIINKAGQLLHLESPLPAYSKLVAAQVQQLKAIDEEMKKMGNPKGVKKLISKDLIKIKEVVEKLLEENTTETS